MLYRNFDEDEIMDSDHYGKHVHAMTGEKLNSKMDIAAELAFRDIQIEQLTAERDELISHNSELKRWVGWGIKQASHSANRDLATKCLHKQAKDLK